MKELDMTLEDVIEEKKFKRQVEILKERALAEKKRNFNLHRKMVKLQHGMGYYYDRHSELKKSVYSHISFIYMVLIVMVLTVVFVG